MAVKTFDIVVALDQARGIGKDNGLPWKLPGDLRFFKKITSAAPDGKRNAVIMGRKTWESIPEKFRPLPGRLNIVLSRANNSLLPPGVLGAASLDEALLCATRDESVSDVFIIGGAAVYSEALRHPHCNRLYVTEIAAQFECDAFLVAFPDCFVEKERGQPQSDGDVQYSFVTYQNQRLSVAAPHLVV